MLAYAKQISANQVYLAVGTGAYRMLSDREVEGILLRGASLPDGSIHHMTTVMDEDDPAELTYTAPHPSCAPDHSMVVGGCGDYRAVVDDFIDGAGQTRLDRTQRRVANKIFARVRDRFPDIADWTPSTPGSPTAPPGSPSASNASNAGSADTPKVITAYGFGGSGWTIAAGVARDVLRLVDLQPTADRPETPPTPSASGAVAERATLVPVPTGSRARRQLSTASPTRI